MNPTIKKIYFMLKVDEVGAYIIPTTDLYDELTTIPDIFDNNIFSPTAIKTLNFFNSIKEEIFVQNWNNLWEDNNKDSSSRLSISDNPELLVHFIKLPNFINKNFKQIILSDSTNILSLKISELLNDPTKLQSTIFLNNIYSDFLIITDEYFLRDDTLYKININNQSIYPISNLNSIFPIENAENFITLFFTHFQNIDFNFLDYTLENGDFSQLTPVIIIEKITPDNCLYMKINLEISTMNYDFFIQNSIKKIALINSLDKKITLSDINTDEFSEVITFISKIIAKHQKKLKIKDDYYFDSENLFILEEQLAKEFIGKELLKLASLYKIIGTEKLKKYNIKAVTPKIIGIFHHSLDFLEGDIQIEIEGETFSLLDTISKYKTDSYILLSDGTNALINHKYIEKLERLFKRKNKNKIKISFFDFPLIDELIVDGVFTQELEKNKNFFKGLNNLNNLKFDFPIINAQLRNYQEYGYKWLSYLIDNNLGACLADDMGLGKTLQAITLLAQSHKQSKEPSLIIMPKSLIFNWENEIQKFAPSLNTTIYYGNDRELSSIDNSQIVLTTYGTVRNDIEKLKDYKFNILVLDESQNIKNINAQTTKSILLLQSKSRIALSGTPIENNLSELYSLFRFLNPTMFGTLNEFNNLYAIPIQKENDKEAMEELRKKIYPFILRRLKKEVLKDLPDKIEQTLFIEMNPEQKRYYEDRRSYYYDMINNRITTQGLEKSQIHILQALNELRQIASCPENKRDYITSSKKELLINNVKDAVANGHKVLIFTNYLASIKSICESLTTEGVNHLSMTGSTKNRQELVEKFQTDSTYQAFVMTLKTGGIGLNLTSADTIFIYDPWWNKTVENQAIDRAYRMGQDRTVFSYKLILKDTIEEKILKLQELKSELLDELIFEDNSSSKFLTEQDIKFILGNEIT